MKNFFEKLRVEDWVVVWVSIPLLLLAALIPADLPSVPATLVGEVAWYNIGLLFAIVLVVLYVGCLLLRRPLKGLLPSLVVVFAVSLLAQVVAKIPAVSYYGFESVRPGDPQRVARPRVDEARHSGRVLHQDRRGVPRRHDPFQRRDEIGGLRTRAGLPRGGRRVVFRLPLLAPHEGRRAFGDDSCERALDLRRLGFDHRGARGRRRRPETFVYRFAGADRRRADDLPHAVAGEPDPAAPVRSRSGRGGRRGVDRRHDRHHVGRRRVEHDRRPTSTP